MSDASSTLIWAEPNPVMPVTLKALSWLLLSALIWSVVIPDT